ncbi:MAG: class II aldolase/adducin family protein [Desulfovibrio sp.]
MKDQLDFYLNKLRVQNLVDSGGCEQSCVAVRNETLEYNCPIYGGVDLCTLFDRLPINAFLMAKPAARYCQILKQLLVERPESLTPEDSETRTFLHEIPVLYTTDIQSMDRALGSRKAVILVDGDDLYVAACGNVTLEQCFVSFSSVCFSLSVMYFSQYLQNVEAGTVADGAREEFGEIWAMLPPLPTTIPDFSSLDMTSLESIKENIIAAGKATVEYGLVDSYFGNISCSDGQTVHISQTGSSLDALAGCIDPCPVDGSSCAGLTASSELSAHIAVYEKTSAHCILHGHPPFSVVLSMQCQKECEKRGMCHTHCKTPRFVCGVPIVAGEVGSGQYGLSHTLPDAIANSSLEAAIVYGHGVFVRDDKDFTGAFFKLYEVEQKCRDEYFQRVTEA